jgi:hypothetical protein
VKLWNDADEARAMVMIEFAGSAIDGESMNLVRAATHKMVLDAIRTKGRQAGPVEWRTYAGTEAADMLAKSDLADHPNAPGLLVFLERPETVLVVASVAYLPVSA